MVFITLSYVPYSISKTSYICISAYICDIFMYTVGFQIMSFPYNVVEKKN